ncbi:MAG: enoyl-CoA hydratase-related protein [Deltaproteobacteria bacterium]|nr:enoyl-CoA hydratase-related protein [Deltaproteobacteria bacterium]
MATFDTLSIESPAPHLRIVTLNRPEAMNALSTRMGEELRAFFREPADLLAEDVRAVILTGAGDKAFCAGADLKERRGMSDETWRRQHVIFEEASEALWRFPIPLLAAVNGVALGGGCEFALACDFILASETARFGQPEVKLGIMPGAGGTQRLPRRVGIARAKELLFTGRLLNALEARDWGLVNHVLPPGGLMDKALELAGMIAANGPIAVRQAKKAVDRGYDLPLAEALDFEIQAYNIAVPSADRQEGINAFNEKRAPRFINR